MYIIDQEVANEIARTQSLINPKMKELFEASDNQANKIEHNWIKELAGQMPSNKAARMTVAYAPLLLENEAITNYINETNQHGLRNMMPEILTASEAALMAQRDRMLTEEETIAIFKEVRNMLMRSSKSPERESYKKNDMEDLSSKRKINNKRNSPLENVMKLALFRAAEKLNLTPREMAQKIKDKDQQALSEHRKQIEAIKKANKA